MEFEAATSEFGMQMQHRWQFPYRQEMRPAARSFSNRVSQLGAVDVWWPIRAIDRFGCPDGSGVVVEQHRACRLQGISNCISVGHRIRRDDECREWQVVRSVNAHRLKRSDGSGDRYSSAARHYSAARTDRRDLSAYRSLHRRGLLRDHIERTQQVGEWSDDRASQSCRSVKLWRAPCASGACPRFTTTSCTDTNDFATAPWKVSRILYWSASRRFPALSYRRSRASHFQLLQA